MRGYQTLIQEAELMAMSPEAVAEFMRRAAQSKREARPHYVDEDTEKALRTRGDTLIDLSLARYSWHRAVVSELFQSSAPDSPIRLACLANRSLPEFPSCLIGEEPGPMAEWLLSASSNELRALLENPTLTNPFLYGLLERKQGWESIDDDHLRHFVSFLDLSPQMRMPSPDFSLVNENKVLEAAWKLAETVPATEAWAFTLGHLFEQLETDYVSIEKPLVIAARWHVAPDDAEANERQAMAHRNGSLGNWERVRKGLARLALRVESLDSMLASDDIAFRAAAYSMERLNAKQLRAGYKKDGELLLVEAIGNMRLWQTRVTRRTLRDFVWDDQTSNAIDRYHRKEQEVRKKHPKWFDYEFGGQAMDDGNADNPFPATKADIFTLSSQLNHNAIGLNDIVPVLRALGNRTSWIWCFSLGALVASVLHF
ncbi:hypothetical protein [Comamonas terrigena]|nr:hypothetical protein [Comamonas terrigena]SUY92149.1 Uncharacterised protein [Comamonas terrigena]